jgi:uncharacterized protein (DUF4415 family)
MRLSAAEWREKFARAPLREGDKIVRRGRPRSPSPKQLVSLRLDREIVTHFKIDGPGWQTRINDVLRQQAGFLRQEAELQCQEAEVLRQLAQVNPSRKAAKQKAVRRAPAKQRA